MGISDAVRTQGDGFAMGSWCVEQEGSEQPLTQTRVRGKLRGGLQKRPSSRGHQK